MSARARALALAVVTAASTSCVGSGDFDDWASDAGPSTTCSGAAKTDAFQTYQLVARVNATGCLVPYSSSVAVWTIGANSRAEAEGCVLEDLGNSGGSLFDLFNASQVEPFYFVVLDGWQCILSSNAGVSASDAQQCVQNAYFGATVLDVTSDVRLPGGGVDYGAWEAWCP